MGNGKKSKQGFKTQGEAQKHATLLMKEIMEVAAEKINQIF